SRSPRARGIRTAGRAAWIASPPTWRTEDALGWKPRVARLLRNARPVHRSRRPRGARAGAPPGVARGLPRGPGAGRAPLPLTPLRARPGYPALGRSPGPERVADARPCARARSRTALDPARAGAPLRRQLPALHRAALRAPARPRRAGARPLRVRSLL